MVAGEWSQRPTHAPEHRGRPLLCAALLDLAGFTDSGAYGLGRPASKRRLLTLYNPDTKHLFPLQ